MKVALITGASGEIGQAIAVELANEGFDLYLHYFQNRESCERLEQQLDGKSKCRLVHADLSKPGGVQQLLDQIKDPIEVLVYNCGRALTGLVTEVTEEELDEMTQLHMKSPFQLTQQLLPKMISHKQGSIIMVSSIWGETGASCEVLYSMLKGGMNTFVKALSKELAPSGIRVNAVAPGMIETKMNDHLTEEERIEIREDIPIGRFGLPHEIADTVGFLISKRSSYITGQVISVNGAWYC
jgi:3-oxoacyl-[acyl-carrier protein] reductase